MKRLEEQIIEANHNDSLNMILESMSDEEIVKAMDEGLLGGIVGGALGITIVPKLMEAICNVLGIDTRGRLGEVLTSRAICGMVGAKMGFH